MVPPLHDEIRRFGNTRIGLPQRLGIIATQFGADILTADKRRVADDEIGDGPIGYHRVFGIGLSCRRSAQHRIATAMRAAVDVA